MQRAVDFLRRELTARDTTVEQLRLDLEERIAGARKPKEPDAGARETPFEPAENARDPGGAEHRRVEQQVEAWSLPTVRLL